MRRKGHFIINDIERFFEKYEFSINIRRRPQIYDIQKNLKSDK